MKATQEPVVQQAVVELRYDKGAKYFDRCGSLTLRLEDTLGVPFSATLPTIQGTQFRNEPERVTLVVSSNICRISQDWVSTAVRVAQLAPAVWDDVSQVLETRKEVVRCGTRFVLVWKVGDKSAGEHRIEQAGLFAESDDWVGLFGTPKTRAWTTTSEDGEHGLRAALSTAETTILGGVLPPELKEIVPNHAIVLDLDYTMPGPSPFEVSGANLGVFVRKSWLHAKRVSASIATKLGLESEGGPRVASD